MSCHLSGPTMSIHPLPGVRSHVCIRKGKGQVEANQTGKGEVDQTEQGKMEIADWTNFAQFYRKIVM
jgi:hypothetical protein